MDTKKIRTKQETRNFANPKGKKQILAIDIGYSAVKVYSENGSLAFPSYVKKHEGEFVVPDDADILYRENESSDVYVIGYNAQKMATPIDATDSESELYGRKRYFSSSFKAIYRAALAQGIRKKEDSREIFIQTGLPSAYVKGDTPNIQKVMSGIHSFDLKIGKEPWQHYSYTIKEENVAVIPQPMGTFYSVITQNDGNFSNGKSDASIPGFKEIFYKNVLVMDVGFGTFDFYAIKNRTAETDKKVSKNDVGMKAVLSEVSKEIMERYGQDIPVSSLQNYLETGTIEVFDEEAMTSDYKSIKDIVEKANDIVFERAFEQAKAATSSFAGYDYIIITGGTGEAWFEKFAEKLKGLKTVKLIPGNIIDHNSMIYSNVRGYYMLAYQKSLKAA